MDHVHLLRDGLGWIAIAAFAGSYLCRQRATLLRAQAGAAGLWIAYGFVTSSPPVVVTNCAVAFMALVYPPLRQRLEARRERRTREAASREHPAYEPLPPGVSRTPVAWCGGAGGWLTVPPELSVRSKNAFTGPKS